MGITPEQQYRAIYGPLADGDYQIGDNINTNQGQGVIIWIFQGQQGLTYVLVDDSSWPFEVSANSVIA